jgi:hypothetical protein
MPTLPIWSIYESPADYPGLFVARKYLLDQPTTEALFSTNLDGVRKQLPLGLYRLPRNPMDHRSVVESWV